MTQFCITGLNETISFYKQRKIPAYTALMNYFRIRFAPGWNGIVNYGAIRELFAMARSTFYRVLRRLSEDGEIGVSKESGRRIHRLSDKDFSDSFDEEEAREKSLVVGRSSKKRDKSKSPARPATISRLETSAYASFLETLALEQRQDFEAFCNRKVETSTFPINSLTAWLNKYHLEYWSQFERKYVKARASAVAPDIPQKLKEAIAAGSVRLERHFSGGEFRNGVFSLDGKGWFNSIDEWERELLKRRRGI